MVRVLLDLEQLLENKQITKQEYEKLVLLGGKSTYSLAFNIILGFGVIAVCGGAIALHPFAPTVITVGWLILFGGIALLKKGTIQWSFLAQICILMGALLLGSGMIWVDDGSHRAFTLVALIYAVAAVFAQSGLLAVLSILTIGPMLGVGTGYSHAAYYSALYEPLLCVITFTILGIALYLLSKKLSLAYERLAIIASRTCLFMVNLGFWIGSLWGDKINITTLNLLVSDISFSIVWALALLMTGIWAWMVKKRWVINVVAVFAGIHFYSQWFEHLGAKPIMVFIAGILALIFALIMRHININLPKTHI